MSSAIHGYNVNNSTKLSYIRYYWLSIYPFTKYSLPLLSVGSWAYFNTVPLFGTCYLRNNTGTDHPAFSRTALTESVNSVFNKFNWEWGNLIDSLQKKRHDNQLPTITKNADASPAVDAAQNEILFPSSVNQRWRPRREDGGVVCKI